VNATEGPAPHLFDPVAPFVAVGSQGVPVWDATSYDFIKVTENDDASDTVNPSLWRMAKLNMIHGLFQVVDGIWQVRGYDLSVMSIIRTNTGYIVIDPQCKLAGTPSKNPSRRLYCATERGIGRDAVQVSSELAMRRIVTGHLPFERALEEKIAAIDADDARHGKLLAAWSKAYPKVGFSRFVCA
jgi:hypothetical protein